MENKLESIPIEPEPVKGLNIKNSVSSVGILNKLKIGAIALAKIAEIPLIASSSTTAKIATR